MPCPNCKTTTTVNKLCGPHIGEYCTTCGRWLRWVPKGSINDFIWPIGHLHKGTPILQIPKEYLIWAANNISSPNLKRKAIEALTHLGVPLPPVPPKSTTPIAPKKTPVRMISDELGL